MPRLAVAFDTNVYRALSRATWPRLREQELNHNVVGYSCYAVVVELLSHLVAPESVDGRASLAALKRLQEHCTDYNGSQYNLRFIAHGPAQICHTLFGIDRNDESDQYGAIVGSIAMEDGLKALTAPIADIAAATARAREAYAASLWSDVVMNIVPEATQWADLARSSPVKRELLARLDQGEDLPQIAGGLAGQIASLAGLQLPPEALPPLVATIMEHYPTVVHYRSLVVRKLIEGGGDMTKRARANGVLDIHVCAATAPRATLLGMPLLLITNDEEILEAASRGGARERIITFPEYQKLLDLEWRAFNDAVGML